MALSACTAEPVSTPPKMPWTLQRQWHLLLPLLLHRQMSPLIPPCLQGSNLIDHLPNVWELLSESGCQAVYLVQSESNPSSSLAGHQVPQAGLAWRYSSKRRPYQTRPSGASCSPPLEVAVEVTSPEQSTSVAANSLLFGEVTGSVRTI